MMSGMAGTVMIWRPRPPQEEEEEVRSASLATGIEGVTVEQWPDFTVKKKKQSKKTKAAAKCFLAGLLSGSSDKKKIQKSQTG